MSIGYRQNIGFGIKSRGFSIAGVVRDAATTAFVTATGITDEVQINAIDAFVVGLKTDGLWTKCYAIYPMVGGTASTHKYNLKDPRDLDAAYRLTFSGTWVHSATGAKPNGTNGAADTFFTPSVVFADTNNVGLSVYVRTNSADGYEFGVPTYTGAFLGLSSQAGGSFAVYLNSATGATPANADGRGFYSASRLGIANISLYKNGAAFGTNPYIAAANLLSSATLSLGVGNGQYSAREQAMSIIRQGFTSGEEANLYTRVLALQTALSRNI